MVATLIALALAAPPIKDCTPRPPKVGGWTPPPALVTEALTATRGGTCQGCVPTGELDRGVRACAVSVKSTALRVEVATDKCIGTRSSYCDGSKGQPCSCQVDIASAEWRGRRFLRVIANPGIDDYVEDLFEVKGKRAVRIVAAWAPYMSALCNEDGDFAPGPKPLQAQWKDFPKDLQLFFCNYDG